MGLVIYFWAILGILMVATAEKNIVSAEIAPSPKFNHETTYSVLSNPLFSCHLIIADAGSTFHVRCLHQDIAYAASERSTPDTKHLHTHTG